MKGACVHERARNKNTATHTADGRQTVVATVRSTNVLFISVDDFILREGLDLLFSGRKLKGS